MRSLVRCAAGAMAALSLLAPACADPVEPVPPRPTAVVIHIDGGLVPETRWLWYDQDGTARFMGRLAAGYGRFRSRVEFAGVERLVAEYGLCARDAALVRPAGADIFTYRVGVRCGAGWRYFTTYDAFTPATETRVRNAVRGFQRLAATLDWSAANDDVSPPAAPTTLRATRKESARGPA